MTTRWFTVLLVVLCALAFGPGLTAPLTHYDDSLYLYQNTDVLGQPGLAGLLAQWSSRRAWSGEFIEFFPLRDTVYWCLYQVFELSSFPYHLTTLCVHVAASFLAMAVLVAAGFTRQRAQLAALIFALHPIHIESVEWAAGLKDPLFSLLLFASLLAYLRYRQRQRPLTYLLMLVCLVGSLLVKSIPIVTPLLFVLCERLCGTPTPWRTIAVRVLGPGVIAGLFLVQFVLIGAANGAVNALHGGSLAAHVVLSFWAQALYLRQALVPYSFRLIYCFAPPSGLLDYRLLVGAGALAALAGLAYRFRRTPLLLWAIGWYLICLLPVANIVPFPAVMADRYLYLSVLSAAVGAATLLTLPRASLSRVLVVGTLCVLTLVTAARSALWQDEDALWAEADLDPECATDNSYPAAQSHILRSFTAHDRMTRLLARERFLAAHGIDRSASREQFCFAMNSTLASWAEFGHPDRADTWLKPAQRLCGDQADTWYAITLVTMHRRLDLAALAARKARQLRPRPLTSILALLTAFENGDTKAPAGIPAIAHADPGEVCPSLIQWADETPRLAVSLQETVEWCAHSTADAGVEP